MMAALFLALAMQAASPPTVPGDVMFLFYKVTALRQMARERGCDAADENRRYDAVRRELIARYGPSIFSPKKQPGGLEGDCGVVLVYRVNLGDLERVAHAAPMTTLTPVVPQP